MRVVQGSTIAALVATSLIVVGCTAPGGTPTPTAAPPTVSSSSTPGTPTASASIVPGEAGLDQLMYDDPLRPVNVQWPVLPGAGAMTAAMQTWVTGLGTRFLAANQPSETAPPELMGTWEILRQGTGLVGVRLRLYEFVGANGANYSRTFYGDTASGGVWSGAQLIKPGQMDAAVAAVVAALKATGRTPFDDPLSDDAKAALLDDLTFDASGNLVVSIPQGGLLPFSDGTVIVTVPAASASGFLTGDALRIASAVPVTPSPSPTQATASSTTSSTTTTAATTEPAPESTTGAPGTVDCSVARCVALTFDDGPSRYTAGILDTLDAAGVKATFFVLGTSATVYPSALKRAASSGMVIGNHTLDHKQLTKLSASGQRSELSLGASRIAAAGGGRPTLFRPPYGSWNADTKALGVPIILWDVDSEDWKNKSATTTTSLIMKEVKRGSIILMHDIWPSTAQALPGIITQLKARGYTLVTVPQLLGTPTAGRVYHGQFG